MTSINYLEENVTSENLETNIGVTENDPQLISNMEYYLTDEALEFLAGEGIEVITTYQFDCRMIPHTFVNGSYRTDESGNKVPFILVNVLGFIYSYGAPLRQMEAVVQQTFLANCMANNRLVINNDDFGVEFEGEVYEIDPSDKPQYKYPHIKAMLEYTATILEEYGLVNSSEYYLDEIKKVLDDSFEEMKQVRVQREEAEKRKEELTQGELH